MSRNPVRRLLWSAAFLLVCTAFPAPLSRAKEMYVYDQDSLVFLSTDVAEGEVVRSYQADGINLIDVTATLVHKGGFKKGLTVVVWHEGYRKPKKGDRNPEPLAVGDRLVLFVVRATPSEFNRIPKDAVIYAPLPGGVRLVQGDHVFGFSQWGNPGPYVANVPSDPAKASLLTIARFREMVGDSLRDTPEWARLVNAKQDQLDFPRLLKLLEDRSGQQIFGGRDYFTERICIRFAESHDPDLLARALPLAKEHHAVSILQCGFGTPKGRDYLLAKVNDPKEPMAARLRYAFAMRHADEVYRSTLTEISVNSHRRVGEADEGNSGYITRIAKAARLTSKDEELCGSLVRCIDYFGQGIAQHKPAPLMADLHGAFAVLKELYDAKPSQELQFAIEKATAWDASAYEKLKSSCGTFISILRPLDPASYGKPEKGRLGFEYQCATLLSSRDAEVQPSVILVHQGTLRKYVLPTQLRIRGWSTGGGSNSVLLPKDLPAGRYHVFFQLGDGDKVISTGHYFAADL